jgi:Flp pilus assembly protein TadB
MMNMASFIVLGIVAVLFVFAVVSSGKKRRANVMGTAVPAFIHVISRRE